MVTPKQGGRLSVEVVCVAGGRAFRKAMLVPEGRNVGWCVRASGVAAMFPEVAGGKVGVWGNAVPEEALVREGDRVEVYLPCDKDAAKRVRNLRKSVADPAKTVNKEEQQ